ncbi:enoyl-CoA hydratase-related protein [Amycolatopsis sp. NPDC005232]|uniref:enoyl-CoA hydratase/isomerase family protein n=1 Tax=Amycolatopsis sp. NPDC005232 TaxID=3157027 RepID=UPI0033B7B4A4
MPGTYDPSTMPNDLEFVKYEKKGHVAYVTINRPEVRNALHTFTYRELRRVWLDMQRDPEVRVGILTGEGKAFCAGRDIKFLAEYQAKGQQTPHEDPSNPAYYWGGGGMPYDANLDKPLIAAINGFAVGVGLTLVMQCQLRVMADDAWLGDQHTNVGRLGSPQAKFLALPRATAAFLTLCNGRLTAQDCYSQGIVNKVAPQSEILAKAEELAAMVVAGSPSAVQAATRVYRISSLNPALDEYTRQLDRDVAATDDSKEGSRAFVERRSPVWQGK